MNESSEAGGDFREHLIRYGGDAYPEIVEKAQGSWVVDAKGRKILDFTSGQMCATVGHNHPNIVAAIKRSCDTALHLFSGMIPRSVVQLADALAKETEPALPVTPCHEPPRPTTSKPPVQSFAILIAASLLSLPVLTNSDFASGLGTIFASASASCTTLRGIMPENRCSAVSQLLRIAATMFGWLWPTVAHI